MIIKETSTITMLCAEEGMKITDKNKFFFSDFIYVPKNYNLDNYEEVPRSIWKNYVEEENPDVVELQEQVKDLKNIDDITMGALVEVDTNANTNIDIVMNAINELYLMIEDLRALKGGE